MPPGAPTDPDVRTLAHPVPLMLDSPCNETLQTRNVILGRDGDTQFRVQSLGRSSRPRVQHQTPLSVFPSLHRVLRDQFAGFIGTMKVLRLPAAHPTALRCRRLAVPRLHSLRSLLDGRVRRRGQELVTRYLHPGIDRGDELDLPSSWGTPIVRLHMFQSDSGRTACTRPLSLQCSSVAPGM